MQYQQLGQGSQFPYPAHNIPADKKGKDFCMQYARAAYYDFSIAYPKGVFANNGGDYDKFRMYALGKQPIGQYKTLLGVDSTTNQTHLVVDWSVRSIVSGYRDKAISRLMKQDFGIVATPIDSLSKSEIDSVYASMKAKLAIRQLMQQQNPELANHPLISIQQGEPMDIEELEMRMESGEQFNRSKDAELAIELGLYENHYKSFRRSIYEDLFDFGVAGYREWLGEDNKAKFRRCNPDNVVISYAKESTFKDLVHAGEVIDVSLVELATLKDEEGNEIFTEKELQEFAGSIAGKFNNPTSLGNGAGMLKPYDKFKCKVLDICFYTYNENVYRDAPDSNGNIDFRKAEHHRKSEKFKRKKIQYVYKAKWVIGTDKCYDFGMCYDQKRTAEQKTKATTKLPFSFIAYNFYEMKAQGFMERLIPYIDDYQLTMLKIQNFKNRAVPSGWWIDLDALESVAMNKGGKNMEPKELLQMFFETGALVGRSTKEDGSPQSNNWKPIIPIENTAASELAMFYQDLVNTITIIEKMVGFNEITSGNGNAKTLVPGYEIANQSTNDALYPMANAEEMLTISLAEDVLCRMKQGVKKGKITGFAPYGGALSSNTLKFIELDADISLRDFGIMLQKRTTEQEKMWLMQNVQQDIANQFLDTSDAIQIIETHNVKQGMQILAYKVKKAKMQAQQNQMAQIQENNKGAQEAAMIAAQEKEKQLMLEYQHKEKMKKMELDAELYKTQLLINSQMMIAQHKDQTILEAAEISNEGKVTSHAIAGEAGIQKQLVANQKQSSSQSK